MDRTYMQQVDELELLPVKDASEIPLAIHGTSLKAWQAICAFVRRCDT
jgi:hypothetical protein